MRLQKIRYIIVMVSLMILLSSSSFFLPSYLTQQIQSSSYSAAEFQYALKVHNVQAMSELSQKEKIGSEAWILVNKLLAKSEENAAFRLASWYQKQALNKTQELDEAILWYKQAIRLGSQTAIYQLALLYFNENNIVDSEGTLSLLDVNKLNDELNIFVIELSVKVAISQGNIARVIQLLELVAPSKLYDLQQENTFSELVSDINHFEVIPPEGNKLDLFAEKAQQKVNVDKNCISSLQLLATNLNHLNHLEKLINEFNRTSGFKGLVCLPTPKYINPESLSCLSQGSKPITCDEARWQHMAEQVKTRHIGLIQEEGGANVHLGILYFDLVDTVDVFSHEVSHLLGFIDEYPLTPNHEKCQQVQSSPFSHNIVVLNNYYQGQRARIRTRILNQVPWADLISKKTPILQLIEDSQSKKKYWKLGTPPGYKEQVGLHSAKTCELGPKHDDEPMLSFSAFKPVYERTQLEYFSIEAPKEYRELFGINPIEFLMPSYHYNIALALFHQGKIKEARSWLKKAAKWERSAKRKAIIEVGAY